MKPALAAFAALPLFLLAMTASSAANGQTAPTSETRIQKADILTHPVGPVALKYAVAIHDGNMDEAMKLASSEAQARWKSQPASERKASADFRKKMIPNRAELEVAIEAGGILIIEGRSRATLNVVIPEGGSSKAGVVQSTTRTIAMPFVLEGGQWKIAR